MLATFGSAIHKPANLENDKNYPTKAFKMEGGDSKWILTSNSFSNAKVNATHSESGGCDKSCKRAEKRLLQ
jgi:hypothetical protein